MKYTPARQLAENLRDTYRPCDGFKSGCEGTATWAPEEGQVPRGFVGALGSVEEVEVVILTAQPGLPLPEESGLYSQAAKEELLERTCQFTFECFRRSREKYHDGIRYLLNQVFHPNRNLEDQLQRAWITQTYLCSAPKGDSSKVRSTAARECTGRYLARQLALFEGLPVIVLGREAQKRARYVAGVRNLIDAPSPNARESSAELQRRYRAAATQARRIMQDLP